ELCDSVAGSHELVRQIEVPARFTCGDPDFFFDLRGVGRSDELAFDGVSEGQHVIDRAGVRAGMNVPQRHEPMRVDFNADLLKHFARGGRAYVSIAGVAPPAGKDEGSGIVAKVRGPPTQIDFDALGRISHESHCRRWYR